jgi:hypothetical protein
MVEQFIEHLGPDVLNETDDPRMGSPLLAALRAPERRKDFVEFLIAKGANVQGPHAPGPHGEQRDPLSVLIAVRVL